MSTPEANERAFWASVRSRQDEAVSRAERVLRARLCRELEAAEDAFHERVAFATNMVAADAALGIYREITQRVVRGDADAAEKPRIESTQEKHARWLRGDADA